MTHLFSDTSYIEIKLNLSGVEAKMTLRALPTVRLRPHSLKALAVTMVEVSALPNALAAQTTFTIRAISSPPRVMIPTPGQ